MNIAIIGGGIGGLAAAVGLHNIGIRAHVYERATRFKPLGAGIGIGSNVMLALQKMGVGKNILQHAMPLHEQRFLNGNLHVLNTIDFTLLKKRFGEENITIERSDLHTSLFQAVDPSFFHFNKRVERFSQVDDGVTLFFTDGSSTTVNYVIAADGIHSIFRQTLFPTSIPRYAGYTCWRGISKNNGEVDMHISSEAWSKKGRFGWAPLHNGDVYWFACINAGENEVTYKKYTKEDVAYHFSYYSPVVERLIKETYDDYFLHHAIYDIKPLSTFVYDRICLLGDAAHATTPNMGQGAGQSIEDAYILMKAIQKSESIEKAFQFYNQKRVKKTKKVIKLSRQIGWAAQWENPLLVAFRNIVFPWIPKTLLFRRLLFLFREMEI